MLSGLCSLSRLKGDSVSLPFPSPRVIFLVFLIHVPFSIFSKQHDFVFFFFPVVTWPSPVVESPSASLLLRALAVIFRAYLDKPGYFLQLKILNLMTSAKYFLGI